jgi:hypothetical protein
MKENSDYEAHFNSGAVTGLLHPPPPATSSAFIVPCLQLVQIVLYIYLFVHAFILLFFVYLTF